MCIKGGLRRLLIVTFELVKEYATWTLGKVFQAESTVSAKVPKWFELLEGKEANKK